MKPLCRAIIALVLSSVAYAENSFVGETEAQLFAAKGPPNSKTTLGTKAIYRWNDAEISLKNGVVTSVTPRYYDRELSLERRAEKAAKAAGQQKTLTDVQQRQAQMINDRYQAQSIADREAQIAREKAEKKQQELADAQKAADAQRKIDQDNQAQIALQNHADVMQLAKDAKTNTNVIVVVPAR